MFQIPILTHVFVGAAGGLDVVVIPVDVVVGSGDVLYKLIKDLPSSSTPPHICVLLPGQGTLEGPDCRA